ncbi:FecR family protein [Sphingobacterium sp. LRF_L2]|uniref:FecR family protein n=1 Tax=Sphingobacterium sp. LRF_L2 TaxID=3369421 RepID=UPI003F5D83D6
MQHKIDKEFEVLVEKYIRKETSAEENKVVHDFFDSFASEPEILEALPPRVVEIIKKRMHNKLMQRLSNNRRQHQPRKAGYSRKIAASIAVVLCLFSFFYFYSREKTETNHTLNLVKGQQRQIILEDGTKVTLNASSKLIYPQSFKDKTTREVTLEGEAYFDVAKNPKKPFLIHTPRMEISVLGTAFNVRDYSEEATAETALIHGKVEIWKVGNQSNKFILRPKEKFVLAEKKKDINISDKTTSVNNHPEPKIESFKISERDGSAQETEWMLKRITIQDEPMSQIALRLERMYGINIHITNTQVSLQMYSATFDNENLDNILKALQTVNPFIVKKQPNGDIEIK